jgi:CRP/FNR family transcriptional regulator
MIAGMADDLLNDLASVPLFSSLSRDDITELAATFRERSFADGEPITREGERGVAFFVLLEGEAVVEVGGRQVNVLRAGDFLGEIALIDDGPRTATVTARGAVRCAGLAPWEFRPFVKARADVAWTLLETLARRMRAG